MVSEKKISIKHFLNKRVKVEDDNVIRQLSKTLYPVYTQITFERKNTQIALSWQTKGFTEEEFVFFFEQREDSEFTSDILYKEKLIRQIIAFELFLVKEKFSLKGLGKRVKFYEKKPLVIIFDNFITKTILPYLEENLTVAQFRYVFEKGTKHEFDIQENVVKINYDFLFHTYMLILETFPSFSKLLSSEDYMKVTAYVQFLHFESIVNARGGVNYDMTNIIDWLDKSELYNEFKQFLKNKKKQDIGNLHFDLNEGNTLKTMIYDFPCDDRYLGKYLDLLESVVNGVVLDLLK